MSKTYGTRTKPANMTDKAKLAMEHAWETQNPGADDLKDIADDIEALEAIVSGTTTGLEDRLEAVEDEINDETTGILDRLDDLEEVVQEEGTVVEPVASTITTDLGGTNDIVYTAVTKGTVGDDITISYVLEPSITIDDGAEPIFTIDLPADSVDGTTIPTLTIVQPVTETAFSVDTLTTSAIEVTLGHDGTDPIVTTVSELKTALEAEADWSTTGYTFTIADGMGGETVPAVAEIIMNSTEALDEDGNDLTVVLGTTDGTISSDVASILLLFDSHALVSAAESESDDQAIDDVGSWQLDNGVDGTVGTKGKILFDSDFIYIAVDDCTTAVSNWKKSTLASI